MKTVLTSEEKKEKKEKYKQKCIELKLEKKNKIIKRERDKQIKRVEKAQSRPKSGFYFFKIDEEENIKKRLNDKDVHKELQKLWKEIKNTDKYNYYNQLAIEYEERKKIDFFV